MASNPLGKEKKKSKGKIEYPADHEPGMRVPKGGSSCAKCEYLKDKNKRLCGNEYFIKWNGSDKIPAPVNEYCSDWFESKDEDEVRP